MSRSVLVVNADARALPLPDSSVDAVVCDPPYNLSFMGRSWDSVGGPQAFQAWCQQWAEEALRVLKPGGWLLAFGGTRTWHRLTCGIEDAGFELRDQEAVFGPLAWLYGSGFPKSRDVSKDIDKAAGAKREVIGTDPARAGRLVNQAGDYTTDAGWSAGNRSADVTAPATPEAARWQGWGTALKPAWEPILVARKPLAGTVAGNVLEHGTGALNIDACRVGGPTDTRRPKGNSDRPFPHHDDNWQPRLTGDQQGGQVGAGRWPANVVLTHASYEVARLRDTINPEVRQLIEGYYDAHPHLRMVPGNLPDRTQPGTGRSGSVLLEGMPERLAENPDRTPSLPLRSSAHGRSQGEDVGVPQGPAPNGDRGLPVEGRELPVPGLSVPAGAGVEPGGSGIGRADDAAERLYPGASAGHGEDARPSVDQGRDGASHQRGQAGQPAGEPGDDRHSGPLPPASGDGPRAGQAAAGERPLEVLASDVPMQWLRYFDVRADGCQPIGTRKVRGSHDGGAPVPNPKGPMRNHERSGTLGQGYADPDGTETIEAWSCVEGCPVALLDQQSGTLTTHPGTMRNESVLGGYHGTSTRKPGTVLSTGDQGGASRFFASFQSQSDGAGLSGPRWYYTAKAPGQERVTIDGVSHPTVKPLELMRWLVRLVTPPGGIVLDMFCGSGTTGEAAMLEGCRAVMIDNDHGSCRSAVVRSDPYVRRRRKLVTTEQGQVIEQGEEHAPRLF